MRRDLKLALASLVLGLGVIGVFGIGSASAKSIKLSFVGSVDSSGATLGGVSAPLGSPFSLDIEIDDALAGTGRYSVESIAYTLTLGTYTTITDWSAVDLVATPSGLSITLGSDPFFSAPGEHFLMSLSGFGPSSISDPRSWEGAGLTGDIIVRGIGGFGSPDQLSGITPYTGTLSLSVTPEPSSLALVGLGLAGLFVGVRRRK